MSLLPSLPLAIEPASPLVNRDYKVVSFEPYRYKQTKYVHEPNDFGLHEALAIEHSTSTTIRAQNGYQTQWNKKSIQFKDTQYYNENFCWRQRSPIWIHRWIVQEILWEEMGEISWPAADLRPNHSQILKAVVFKWPTVLHNEMCLHFIQNCEKKGRGMLWKST